MDVSTIAFWDALAWFALTFLHGFAWLSIAFWIAFPLVSCFYIKNARICAAGKKNHARAPQIEKNAHMGAAEQKMYAEVPLGKKNARVGAAGHKKKMAGEWPMNGRFSGGPFLGGALLL